MVPHSSEGQGTRPPRTAWARGLQVRPSQLCGADNSSNCFHGARVHASSAGLRVGVSPASRRRSAYRDADTYALIGGAADGRSRPWMAVHTRHRPHLSRVSFLRVRFRRCAERQIKREATCAHDSGDPRSCTLATHVRAVVMLKLQPRQTLGIGRVPL